MAEGWICPRCRKVWAPSVKECSCVDYEREYREIVPSRPPDYWPTYPYVPHYPWYWHQPWIVTCQTVANTNAIGEVAGSTVTEFDPNMVTLT